MKIIAFDIWLSNTWSAIWDTNFCISFPYKLIKSKKEIFEFIKKEDPWIIIIWHPKTNETKLSSLEEYCLNIYNEIKTVFNDKKIILLDERFTSEIAKQKLRSAGMWYKNNKDLISAQLILETYFLQNWK